MRALLGCFTRAASCKAWRMNPYPQVLSKVPRVSWGAKKGKGQAGKPGRCRDQRGRWRTAGRAERWTSLASFKVKVQATLIHEAIATTKG
ncbi:hypothetical protein JMJ77_0012474 [Colletotrichum scovillei]|uniref:Uncharacterized protein n=1 Tax=Colletotrichum scovillei TaxID=1209932 RepID=A0A9P7QVR9_9PEZI|nr:hypothetical protein JMJ78_0001530 [Colletotrichum scovillei]KAG7041958.1 hypothetical protein JMJ77_0012474 [Colletotrichum scovillei]KAG7061989.1 hypothetical protein JMJ76_0003943 [Colletotrichum scovillei]